MVVFSTVAKLATVGFAALSVAHPGHEEHVADRAVKRSFMTNTKRSLDACADHLERRGTLRRAEEKRRAYIKNLQKKELRKKAQIKARDTTSILAIDHHSTLTGITIDSDSSSFFTDSVCLLSPEGEVGPFWVKGELNREDISGGETGVPNYIHAQFIDVNTCEPLPNLWWDVWHVNATGVYSGVQDDANGNGDDASNLDNTNLRGIQETDEDGVASFQTIFPGHYSGRCTHVHVVGHVNASLLSNGTIDGGAISHIGQLFFDQDLITEVEATYPYNTSTVDITLNSADHVVLTETEDSTSDPIFNYVYLGDDVSDGLFSWVTIGVDPTASYNASYAALLTADGGIKEVDSGLSTGGGPGGNGTMPSGGAGMSGAAPSGSAVPAGSAAASVATSAAAAECAISTTVSVSTTTVYVDVTASAVKEEATSSAKKSSSSKSKSKSNNSGKKSNNYGGQGY